MDNCRDCKFWDNAEGGEWGTCTLSDPDNGDETPIRAFVVSDVYEAIVETKATFGCTEFEEYEDSNV